MKKFINRREELDTLEKQYGREGASFVVIYGRRRVGKTALISEFLRGRKEAVYFLATKESEAQNLKSFRELVADYTGNELLSKADASWEQTFKVFAGHRPHKKQIIVMDEFQYIGQSNPAFPSIMQKVWETVLKNANVMLIVCGSLISLMKAQVLDHNSPLYGRRTAQIKLKQIEFKHYKDFFENKKTAEELVLFYAATGGIPKYIEEFEKFGDVFEAINASVLRKNSFLYEEPYFLLQAEVSEIGSYFSLIKTIAAGNRKMKDIASGLGVPQTNLTKYLKVLTDLDLIEREVPVTEAAPDKSKSGLYKITDNFIAFWFKFVYPYYSYLERGETSYVSYRIKNGFIQNYASLVYEDLCRKKMWELNAGGVFGFRFNKIGRYWGAKAGETDIVALDTVDKNIIVGECKYTSSEKGLGVLHNLEGKAKALKEMTGSQNVRYIIFSPAGFSKGLREEAQRRNDVTLVSTL